MALESTTRSPRGTVILNGTQVPWTDVEVTNNTFYSPDRFEVTLPVSSLPKGMQRADLADTGDLEVEVRVSLDGSAGASLIIGRVDDIEDSILSGTIRLSGRDHTADLIETKTTEKFQNQTASQIVQTLAGRHGLTADVTATTEKSGRYYQIDHDRLTDESTEWDLLTYLAQKEGFDVWVTGRTLHFHPSSEAAGPPIVVTYKPATDQRQAQGDFIDLRMRRSLTLAQDVTVIVYSWNHKQKKAFKVTAKATKTKGKQPNGKPQVYTYRIPGLTKDQALQEAQRRAEEITRHERVIELTQPGDVTTTARDQIDLRGTGTSYDQLYWIDEISRRLSIEEGFDMTIKAKNHSPQSTVTA